MSDTWNIHSDIWSIMLICKQSTPFILPKRKRWSNYVHSTAIENLIGEGKYESIVVPKCNIWSTNSLRYFYYISHSFLSAQGALQNKEVWFFNCMRFFKKLKWDPWLHWQIVLHYSWDEKYRGKFHGFPIDFEAYKIWLQEVQKNYHLDPIVSRT